MPCGCARPLRLNCNTLDALTSMNDLPTISDKGDLIAATQLVVLGYPAVRDILPDLFTWIQDGNWPVARIIAPFLASLGNPSVPEIWKILRSDDLLWKYWCISMVIAELPLDVAVEFEPELQRMVDSPDEPEQYEELDRVAREALEHLAVRHNA